MEKSFRHVTTGTTKHEYLFSRVTEFMALYTQAVLVLNFTSFDLCAEFCK